MKIYFQIRFQHDQNDNERAEVSFNLNEWNHITIRQYRNMISDTYHTRVIVNGVDIFHQENPNPQEYYDCYMFTSGADDS